MSSSPGAPASSTPSPSTTRWTNTASCSSPPRSATVSPCSPLRPPRSSSVCCPQRPAGRPSSPGTNASPGDPDLLSPGTEDGGTPALFCAAGPSAGSGWSGGFAGGLLPGRRPLEDVVDGDHGRDDHRGRGADERDAEGHEIGELPDVEPGADGLSGRRGHGLVHPLVLVQRPLQQAHEGQAH